VTADGLLLLELLLELELSSDAPEEELPSEGLESVAEPSDDVVASSDDVVVSPDPADADAGVRVPLDADVVVPIEPS
jgi:hypothetical protein